MPSDVARLRRTLTHYMKACDLVLEDLFSPRDIYVSFDHSLIHPWLARGVTDSVYDVTGSRLFELYNGFGHLTPYTLTLGTASYVEILDQLDHKRRSLERIMDGRGVRQLFRTMTSEKAYHELTEVRKKIDYGSINEVNFNTFLDLLNKGHISGSSNAMPVVLRAENLTIELMNKQKEILLEKKRYRQHDDDDRQLHLELDAIHLLGVTGTNIANEAEDKIMVYCGERSMQYAFAQRQAEYSRDPLCVLISCYAFSQCQRSASAVQEAKTFVENFSNGMQHAIEVLNKYSGKSTCLSEFYLDDQRLLQTLQEQYITKLYFIQPEGTVPNKISDGEVLESLSDAIMKASGEYESVSSKAGNLANLVEQSADIRLFGDAESEIISDGAKRRMEAIMRDLAVKN